MPDNPVVIYAPILIGLMVCCLMYGVTLAQAFFYFATYTKDPRGLKTVVAVCLALDTVHIALVYDAIYVWMIHCKLPENYDSLPIFLTSFGSSVFITYAVTTVVQSFYIHRVWRMSKKNKWLCSALVVLTVLQLGGGLILCIYMFVHVDMVAVHTLVPNIGGGIELVATTLCDMIISGALVHFLNRARTGFKSTENVINRLIIFSVNTGMLTSVIAIFNLVLWLVLPDSFLFVAFHVVLSKLYVNSLLVTLNTRASVRMTLHSSGDPASDTAVEFQGVTTNGHTYALTPLKV